MGTGLKELIESSKMTVRQIGDRVGKSGAQISRYQNDHRNIPDEVAILLAELFGVSPFDIKESFAEISVKGLDEDEARIHLGNLRRAWKYKLMDRAV